MWGYRRLHLNKLVRLGIHVDFMGLFNNFKYTFEDKGKSETACTRDQPRKANGRLLF